MNLIAQEEALGLGIGFMILWGLFCLVIFLVSLAIYFVPLFIAWMRKHDQIVALGALNLLLGWTFVGWALAIVWALMNPRQPQVVMMPQQPTFMPQFKPLPQPQFEPDPPKRAPVQPPARTQVQPQVQPQVRTQVQPQSQPKTQAAPQQRQPPQQPPKRPS